jgi:hypothetical protein
MGETSLRRRVEPTLGVDVYEAKLDKEFLMSSLFTVSSPLLVSTWSAWRASWLVANAHTGAASRARWWPGPPASSPRPAAGRPGLPATALGQRRRMSCDEPPLQQSARHSPGAGWCVLPEEQHNSTSSAGDDRTVGHIHSLGIDPADSTRSRHGPPTRHCSGTRRPWLRHSAHDAHSGKTRDRRWRRTRAPD